jgi:TRAP-type C4-dicarboxylate transport system permease small subunit
MTPFARANAWMRRLLAAIIIVSVVGLTGTITVQVVLRYLLQVPLMGVEEMSTLFGLWLYFAGLALVSVTDSHIRGGFFLAFLSARAKDRLDRLFLLACAGLCVYFLLLSLDYTEFVLDVNRRSTFLRWPSAVWIASLDLGLALAAVGSVLQALDPARRAPA